MKKKFSDVQDMFSNHGFTIERTADNYNMYIVKSIEGDEQTSIYFTYKMNDVIEYIKKNSIQDFIRRHVRGNPNAEVKTKNTRVSKSQKARVSKSKNENIKVHSVELPQNLKKRRLAADITPVMANDEPTPAIANAAYSENAVVNKNTNIQNIEDVSSVNVLDYTVKTPKHHSGYYFPSDTAAIMRRLALGRNIFLSGPTGCGKSEFVRHLADFMGQKVVRVNLSVGTTEGHLIGKFVVKDGGTKFIYGIVPMAMKNGWWLLLDEIDFAQAEHLAILQSILEGDTMIISQNENEVIVPHENFRIFATANTKGRGDATQSYVGTNFLNISFLDRWSVFEFGYTSSEKSIIKSLLKDDEELAEMLIKFFGMLRKATQSGEIINSAFSTRRIVYICEMLAIGESMMEVMTYELFSRYETYEADIIKELAFDVFDKTHYFQNDWKIGDKHISEIVQDVTAPTASSTPAVDNANLSIY